MPAGCETRCPRTCDDSEDAMSETVQATNANAFDFLVGTWKVHNRRLRKALAGCDEWYEFEATCRARSVLGGVGSFDEYDAPGEDIHGVTLRLYDPATDEWLLYWSSARG